MSRALTGLLLLALSSIAAAQSGNATTALRFEEVLHRAVLRASAEDARLVVTKYNLKLLEALGRTRIELRPSLGLLAFSNPVLLATNIGSSLLFNRRTAPSAAVLQSARFDVLASELQAHATRIQAQTGAARAYFELLEKQQAADRAQAALGTLRRRSGEIERLLRATRITAYDQVSFEQQLVDLEWQSMEAQAQRKSAAGRLALLIGLDGEPAQIRVEDENLFSGAWQQPAPPLQVLLASAAQNRSELQLVRTKLASLQREAPGQRVIQFDSLNAGYSYVSNTTGIASSAGGFLLGGNSGHGELALRVPLRDTGEKAAQNALLAARIRLLETEIRNIEDSIRAEVMTLESETSADLERVRLAARRVELAQKAYDVIGARSEAGLAQPAAVAQAAQAVLAAQSSHSRAINERKASLFTLNMFAGLDQPAADRSRGDRRDALALLPPAGKVGGQ